MASIQDRIGASEAAAASRKTGKQQLAIIDDPGSGRHAPHKNCHNL
jgi:hypothetical protein